METIKPLCTSFLSKVPPVTPSASGSPVGKSVVNSALGANGVKDKLSVSNSTVMPSLNVSFNNLDSKTTDCYSPNVGAVPMGKVSKTDITNLQFSPNSLSTALEILIGICLLQAQVAQLPAKLNGLLVDLQQTINSQQSGLSNEVVQLLQDQLQKVKDQIANAEKEMAKYGIFAGLVELVIAIVMVVKDITEIVGTLGAMAPEAGVGLAADLYQVADGAIKMTCSLLVYTGVTTNSWAEDAANNGMIAVLAGGDPKAEERMKKAIDAMMAVAMVVGAGSGLGGTLASKVASKTAKETLVKVVVALLQLMMVAAATLTLVNQIYADVKESEAGMDKMDTDANSSDSKTSDYNISDNWAFTGAQGGPLALAWKAIEHATGLDEDWEYMSVLDQGINMATMVGTMGFTEYAMKHWGPVDGSNLYMETDQSVAEFKQNPPTKDGIYKTQDDKYFQVIDGKINEDFELKDPSKTPNWKNFKFIKQNEIDTLFKGHAKLNGADSSESSSLLNTMVKYFTRAQIILMTLSAYSSTADALTNYKTGLIEAYVTQIKADETLFTNQNKIFQNIFSNILQQLSGEDKTNNKLITDLFDTIKNEVATFVQMTIDQVSKS